jgi:hypothetical protein
MRLKLLVCLVFAVAITTAQQMLAAPFFSPFLAVDIDAYNAGGGQSIGPTAAGFQGWENAEGLFLDPSIDWASSGAAGLTKVFPTANGNITANMIGFVPNASRGARNRGANSDVGSDLTSDFVFAARDNAIAFGRNYIKLTLSGLTANQQYEFTGWARDHFNGATDSFQAWSDLALLGGVDGPSAWLDANVGAGASYQPAVGGINNVVPHYERSPVSGAAGADAYTYARSFVTNANASGVVTIYTWADPNTFSGIQGASLLNGFQLGVAPEPTSFVLCGLGFIGLVLQSRRR